jgi:hypothetical protein
MVVHVDVEWGRLSKRAKVANNASTNAQIPPLVDSRISGDGHLVPRNGRFWPTEAGPVHAEPFVVRSGPFSLAGTYFL